MTQESRSAFGVGKLALGAAALLLAVAVGYSVLRGHGSVPVKAASVPATAPGSGSLEALEDRVSEDPKDAAAWLTLGAQYYDLGRFDDAVRAYEGATTAAPSAAQGWSALGEARVMASRSDPMPAAAAEAFAKAVTLDPKDPRARYFLAVKRDLAGDHQGAIADWLKLLEDTPPGAPWEADLKRTIEQVGKINKIEVVSRLAAAEGAPQRRSGMVRGIPGPNVQDLSAAAAVPPSEQREMAEGMVARLEARLRDQPANVDGWIMLMRSRMTLGEPDRARAALNAAVAANPLAEAQLRQQAAVLGVR